MDEYLSIGEIAKLNNISVQTLRYYEKLGLMYPSFINEETGYRYYSVNDLISIGLIKQCRAIGLSLNEINEIITSYTSLESISTIIKNQKKVINEKIKELELIYSQISSIESNIGLSIEKGLNNVFVVHNEERKCIRFNYSDRNELEFEYNLRKSIIKAEKDYKNANTEIVFTVPYNEISDSNIPLYGNVMLNLGQDVKCNNKNIISMEEGNYLTIYFDDVHNNSHKYYEIIMSYIKSNKIKPKGDFREIYILTRLGNDGVVKSLGKIEILI